MNSIYNYTLEQLQDYLVENKFKKFNARQIFEWVYKKNVTNFDEMSNLSKTLREHLVSFFTFGDLVVSKHQKSSDGTEKFLFKLEDGNLIETVLMRHNYGNSVCVTTQLGCNIGCSFCASGLLKKKRDLLTSEIVLQIVKVANITKERVSHVVIMGIGEPFDNYNNTVDFIHVINSPYGLEIGARHITVSTSGIVPKIYEFSTLKIQSNLAISLHAPNDTLRSSIMKINNVYPLNELIESIQYYIEKTNRRITFEYILLSGVNDDIKYADELSDLIRGLNAYVNLIRYNNVSENSYDSTNEERAYKFHQRLLKRGITATLRKEQGSDIDAACGQLRHKNIKK